MTLHWTLWVALAGINVVALLVTILLNRAPQRRPEETATVADPDPAMLGNDDPGPYEALLQEADRAEVRLFRKVRGEQRLASDVARWQSERGGEVLPEEDTACRSGSTFTGGKPPPRRETRRSTLARPLIGKLG